MDMLGDIGYRFTTDFDLWNTASYVGLEAQV